MFFRNRFVDDFWDDVFVDLYQNWFPFRARGRPLFGYLFASWLTLASVWLPFRFPFELLVPFQFRFGIGNLRVRHPNL